ncbi:BRCT domain-containing protein [Lactifluus volemus]|nr:BRCT domain-containing protein [Lactifluus volemus]
MDKFVTSGQPTHNRNYGKEGVHHRYSPYTGKDANDTGGSNNNGRSKTCAKTLTRHLLTTLKDESNPITHSDIGLRSDRVVSLTTGHQRPDGRANRQPYMKIRSQKLKDQREEMVLGILKNTRIYINGYLRDTTDIEMKRIVTEAGGHVIQSVSGATHIVTSQPLSGNKTQELLTWKSKRKVYVVKPEWVRDCIAAGKRIGEGNYVVERHGTAPAGKK